MAETPSRCPSCGAVLASGAKFCPECGKSVGEKNRSPLPILLGLLGGIAIILLLFLLLRSRKEPAITAALPPAPTGPPLASAPYRPPTGPSISMAPKKPVDPMQAALEDYLKKMAAIEAQRKQIVSNIYPAMLTASILKGIGGMQDALQMFDENLTDDEKKQTQPKSVQQAQDTINSYRNQFKALAMEVQRIAPPTPARRFQNGYIYSLGAYDSILGVIDNSIQSGDVSIAGRGAELSQKVAQCLKATDDELANLLQQYHLTRSFTVNDDLNENLMGGTGL